MNDIEARPVLQAGRLLEGKTALIFGAGAGIGAGAAEVFAAAGARVLVTDREGEKAQAVCERLGEGHRWAQADVGVEADIAQAANTALESFGRIDILLQNAGIFPWTLIENISAAEWDQVLGVNLRGCFLSARACLPAMKAQGGGRMIFTSSITGTRVTSPGHGHYAASKGGINGFVRSAALEFARYNITVNGVEPGNIMTEGMRTQRSPAFIKAMTDSIPMGRLGTPQEVGQACLFLASDLAGYITGTTILIDGGQTLPEGGNFAIDPD